MTDLDWTYGEEGPIDTRFYHHTARLEAAGLLREEVRGWTVRYAPASAAEPDLEAALSPGERRIVAWVAGEAYGPLPTETLLERVLESPPVRAGAPRHPLDLTLVDGAGPREVEEREGFPSFAALFDLDESVLAHASADRGERWDFAARIRSRNDTRPDRSKFRSGLVFDLVAGEGFEPPTFGL